MTNRAIVVLAVAATACLVLGARLLDAANTGSAATTDSAGISAIAAMAVVVGTAFAATAVAGAWRPPPRRPEPDSDCWDYSPRPGSEAGPT